MAKESQESLLLRDSRIVAPDRVISHGAILIQEGNIARIFESDTSNLPVANGVLELHGLTIFPGFIDVHIHGAVGVDTMEASVDDLCLVGEFLAQKGTTAWMPTLVPSPAEKYEQAIRSIGESIASQQQAFAPSALNADKTSALPAVGSLVLGVHYEGPFVNTEQCGALHREHFRTFTKAEDLDILPTIPHTNVVHMMTLAPEVEGGIELIKELKKRNWVVSIGHTRADASTLDKALKAGARHMTHFMNAMTPLHHRSMGAVGWGLIHDDVSCDMIADGIHMDQEILKLVVRNKTAAKVSLISDAIAAAGQGDGDYQIWGEKIAVKNGRTQNARGSIAGSVITMLDAVRMMLLLGFSECDIARMASLNPAKLLGIERECGSIEQGKRADLVALDDSNNVRLTIIGGKIAHSEE